MRRQLADPALWPRTRFIESPQRRHSSVRARPSVSAGARVSRSSTSSTPTSRPMPRTSPIASCRSWSSRRRRIRRSPRRLAAPGRSSLSTTSSTRRRRRGRQRVRDVRGHVDEAALEAALLDLGASSRRPPIGMPPPSVFDSTRKSGHHVVDLEAVHRAEPAEAGLALVEDEEHAALLAQLGQAREVAGRRDDHAAGREDRLGEHRRRRAHATPGRRARSRPRGRCSRTSPSQCAHRAAVLVGRGHREGARQRGRARGRR